MGTVKHLGWSTSYADIPQPTSIIMGKNLRHERALQFAREVFKPARPQKPPTPTPPSLRRPPKP